MGFPICLSVFGNTKSLSELFQNYGEAADLFEAGKVLGQIEEVVVSYKEGAAVTAEIAEKLVMALGKAEQSDFIVSFVHFDRIVEGNKITALKPEPPNTLEGASALVLTKRKLYVLCAFADRVQTIDLPAK